MPADSTEIVAGNATVTIGADLGYVKAGGITVTPTVDLFEVDVEQLSVSPKAFYTMRHYEISFILTQPTHANLVITWDLPSTPAAGPPETLAIIPTADMSDSFTPTQRVLVITGTSPTALGVRTISWDAAILITPGPLVLSKMAYQEQEVTFKALYDDAVGNQVGDFSDAVP